MKKNDINKKIASLLIRTRNCSDGGKDRMCMNPVSRTAKRDNCHGYRGKEDYLLLAINMISRNRKTVAFKYAVVYNTEDDYYNAPLYIVYFSTHINGVPYQISFHSYDLRLERYVRKSFRIKWDRENGLESVKKIYSHYFPNGIYA